MPQRGRPRSAEALVERQLKRWEVEGRAAVPKPGAPCIALSRQPGACGSAIAEKVAGWLDYGLFGSQIVDTIAKAENIERELVDDLDEQVRTSIHRYVHDSFASRRFSESDYLRAVGRTVSALAERGMAVIVGRGATYILPADRTLRVRVVAPRSVRVQQFSKDHDISIKEAEQRLDHEDRLRSDFVKVQFRLDPDDPSLYDLVVNTGSFDVEGAAKVIVEALRRRFPSVK